MLVTVQLSHCLIECGHAWMAEKNLRVLNKDFTASTSQLPNNCIIMQHLADRSPRWALPVCDLSSLNVNTALLSWARFGSNEFTTLHDMGLFTKYNDMLVFGINMIGQELVS